METVDTVEKTFTIHRYAAAGLVKANAVAAALRAAAAMLEAQANDGYAKAAAPIMDMLGIEEGTILRVDDNNGTPTVTIRVSAPKPSEPTAPTLPIDEEIIMMSDAPKAES